MKKEKVISSNTGVVRHKIRVSKFNKRTQTGNASFVYELPSSLVFSHLNYKKEKDGNFNNKKYTASLKYKNGKFNVYQISEKGFSNISPRSNTLLAQMIYNHAHDPKKATTQRGNKLLRGLLKRVGVKKKIDSNLSTDKNILRLCYPGLSDLPPTDYIPSSEYSRKIKNSKNFREVVYKSFGWKDEELYNLVLSIVTNKKKVSNNLDILLVGMLFRGIFKLEQVKTLLSFKINELHIVLYLAHYIRNGVTASRKFLKAVPVGDRYKLIEEVITKNNNLTFHSLVRLYDAYGDNLNIPYYSSLPTATLYSKIKEESKNLTPLDYKISIPEKALGIDGIGVDEETMISIPKTAHQIINWMDELGLENAKELVISDKHRNSYYVVFHDDEGNNEIYEIKNKTILTHYSISENIRNNTKNINFLVRRNILSESYKTEYFELDDPFTDE